MPTLATVATEFLERPGLAPSTVRSYTTALLPLLANYCAWPITHLDRKTLQDYLQQLEHLSYTTHRRHQAILQSLLNFAVEQQYLVTNPLARLPQRKPNPNKGEHHSDQTIRYLTPDQLQVLYQATAQQPRLHCLVRLLHRTGARIAELLSLDYDQVDLQERRFQVVGKGNKQRWCFYSPDVDESLGIYLKYYRHPEHPALFTAQQPLTKAVSRLSYRTAYSDWRTMTQREPQLQGLRFHDLRHTFATERVGLMGIETLRALMGHENIQTTLRYQKVTSQRAETIAKEALTTLIQDSN